MFVFSYFVSSSVSYVCLSLVMHVLYCFVCVASFLCVRYVILYLVISLCS